MPRFAIRGAEHIQGATYESTWIASSYGSGRNHWFVWRKGAETATTYEGAINALDAAGRPRRFASLKAAQRVADDLNRL